MTDTVLPKKAVNVKPGEYAALVNEYDDFHNITGKIWVMPTWVYRGGVGRHLIQFEHNGETLMRQNYPGASSFELYKRVS